MKKIYFVVAITLLLALLLNYFNIREYKNNRIEFAKRMILEQTQSMGSSIEKNISTYENDLTRILYKNIQLFPELFNDEKVFISVTKDLRNFYAKHRGLISNIAVYDNKNRYLGIYVKENEEIVLDTFPRQGKNQLFPKEKIIKRNGYYHKYFPFFKNDVLYGNVEVEMDFENYLKNLLNSFKITGIYWQWVTDTAQQVIFTNSNDSALLAGISDISYAIKADTTLIVRHDNLTGGKSKSTVISVIYPLNMLNNDLALVFSLKSSGIMNSLLTKEAVVIFISLFLILLLIIYLVYSIYNSEKLKKDKIRELISLKMTVEHFPVGIMVQDAPGKIKYINRTGQNMLFINADEEIIGKLSDQLLISNKYLLKDGFNVPFDSNHFIHYEKDGNEIVIYRKDAKKYVEGEELMISALIDVSPLERSRKQEAAANMAKSEFLAKMSHEIRTPMNGIICMAGNLLKGDMNNHEKEQVQIIKQSSDLLMNLINDILDLSKIEAGRMMLEEIPFRLSEELNLSIKLFKPVADEKGLEIITEIHSDVPEMLIGDPFRIRQVIANLISNAIKFTQNGKIVIEISLLEKYNLALSLLFSVADTGIGIPKESINKIFASYEQGKNSLSRKYGGTGLGTTISKQLVEMMNGEIWVESPSGISTDPALPGSKFSFSIEVYSNTPLIKKYDFSSITQFQAVSVLIISKIKDEQDTVSKFLDGLGISYNYRIFDESNSEILINHITQRKNIYQLIFILDKPGYDGYEIAAKLKENGLSDNFCIILISSNDEQGNYVKSKSLDIDHYLIQPFEPNELSGILESAFPGIQHTATQTDRIARISPELRILLVEDNIMRQRATQNIFKKLGFEIEIAKNGVEALAMLSKKKYDIVFMDIIMPEMDGITATKEIRKIYGNELPIIAITADEENDREEEAMAAGMNGYINKPIKIENIKKVLFKWFYESTQ